MKLKKAIPILRSSDMQRSIDYYTQVLGFSNVWTWGDPVDFAGMSKDDVELFFCLNDQGHPGMWIALVVDDVDVYYESIKDKATILAAPTTQEWNMREMVIQDPDGHILRIGHNTDCD